MIGAQLWSLIKPHVLGMIVGVLVVVGVYAAWQHWRPVPQFGVAQLAAPAKIVAAIQTEAIQPKRVIVYKQIAKKKLDLPAAVQADTKEHVAAATTIKADEHPHTVTTVVNEDTGKVKIYDKQEALPWLGVDTHTQVGIFYGYRGLKQIERLSLEQNLVQVKAIHVQLAATVDSDGQHFVGAGLVYRW